MLPVLDLPSEFLQLLALFGIDARWINGNGSAEPSGLTVPIQRCLRIFLHAEAFFM
jgi:hypothetical protein